VKHARDIAEVKEQGKNLLDKMKQTEEEKRRHSQG
jgi:hypothetical protein